MSLVAAKSSKLIKVIFVKMVMTDPDPDPDADEDALRVSTSGGRKGTQSALFARVASPTLPHSLATNLFANENAKARFEKM